MDSGCCAILFAASTALAGDLPDPTFTPGDADSSLTKEAICSPGTSKSRRYVRAELKRKVYALYGMTPDGDPCPCEVDHLIPLALGGDEQSAQSMAAVAFDEALELAR
jgi:hypothetical protein